MTTASAEEAVQLLDDAVNRISEVAEDTKKEQKMAPVASKEIVSETDNSSSSSMFSMIYSAAKKVVLVGGIYLVGYMGWSVAWLIGS